MFPASFDFFKASSVADAVSILSREDDAKLLAGGHSLLPLMKLRLASPAVLVDISALEELAFVEDKGDYVAVGALTRHHDVANSELLKSAVPILPFVASKVGDPSVRHRGTIGGSIAHGDGASDLPAAILALDSDLVAVGPDGERVIQAKDFFLGFLETALRPNEILTEIRVPKFSGGWSYQKFNRRAQDWAIVGVAAVHNGSTKISLVNMASTPIRASAVEAALADGASVEVASGVASEGLEPPSDLNASADYRRHLAQVLVKRALTEALG
ncbi:MAG: xanthine dehydrogenase family protein subunit M [Acidimicrobiaceae bacterium]|nr:xanthine dehydrogenase family protein subunit M [Acidimicrobiaceae bacterium]